MRKKDALRSEIRTQVTLKRFEAFLHLDESQIPSKFLISALLNCLERCSFVVFGGLAFHLKEGGCAVLKSILAKQAVGKRRSLTAIYRNAMEKPLNKLLNAPPLLSLADYANARS